MVDKNICVFRGVQNIAKYVTYLLDQSKHQGQVIMHNNVLEKIDLLEKTSQDWKEKQTSKRGAKPKPLSLVLSFPSGTKQDELIPKALSKVHMWFKTISRIDKLGLNDDDIEEFVKNIPFVAHFKVSNPHLHLLIPRILPNKNTPTDLKISYKNLYTYRYQNPLFRISGWSIKDKVLNSVHQDKLKVKSSELYLKQKLEDEIQKYQGLNEKLDKYLELVHRDLKRGHTDKAQKKIENIIRRNK